MQIAVIGTGYVGLVTGACLANTGQRVACVDKDPEVVETLREGDVPFYEQGLERLVTRNAREERLTFTTDAASAIADSDILFIAVGTPMDEDGSADLTAVEQVAKQIGNNIDGYTIVISKSTVPVGTTERVGELIDQRTDEPFDVASNPEFMKEGSAVSDFQSPQRVVIGCDNPDARQTIADLYRPFMQKSERFVFTDPRTSEMIKYASNSMLATKISFINEMANICDQVGADVEQVRRGMSMDQRIGPHFIFPGVGYGGSCFPKDVKALATLAGENGAEPHILTSVDELNERQKLYLFDRARDYYDTLDDKTFAVWGLSFKPGTDDIRNAPAIENIRELLEAGATVRATDPQAIANAREALDDVDGDLEFSTSNYSVTEGADALFLFTEWEQFRHPDFQHLQKLMDQPTVFDGRNIYNPDRLDELGFNYVGVGRPTINST
jgi:UDPglucose 6-dehydrogenase